ncbi:uncharacterized protein BT62DRAFT_1080358 [Guyanagaster necrorhizus]|uniref:Uncharacterized protein n=1 Tax=Guyanagaster necrorhizus TaxID=856835 RepID=A0A9P8AMV7_9AGAR|nr:uncharacterized protein BT62DRAFT_1080358 [Guyanagaster necrorhizus MCA 3950]KAG7441169.1 hypothetical protein BT62DRAFT_1080358 [Guyanagaster necrorhizus MCA 3950]
MAWRNKIDTVTSDMPPIHPFDVHRHTLSISNDNSYVPGEAPDDAPILNPNVWVRWYLLRGKQRNDDRKESVERTPLWRTINHDRYDEPNDWADFMRGKRDKKTQHHRASRDEPTNVIYDNTTSVSPSGLTTTMPDLSHSPPLPHHRHQADPISPTLEDPSPSIMSKIHYIGLSIGSGRTRVRITEVVLAMSRPSLLPTFTNNPIPLNTNTFEAYCVSLTDHDDIEEPICLLDDDNVTVNPPKKPGLETTLLGDSGCFLTGKLSIDSTTTDNHNDNCRGYRNTTMKEPRSDFVSRRSRYSEGRAMKNRSTVTRLPGLPTFDNRIQDARPGLSYSVQVPPSSSSTVHAYSNAPWGSDEVTVDDASFRSVYALSSTTQMHYVCALGLPSDERASKYSSKKTSRTEAFKDAYVCFTYFGRAGSPDTINSGSAFAAFIQKYHRSGVFISIKDKLNAERENHTINAETLRVWVNKDGDVDSYRRHRWIENHRLKTTDTSSRVDIPTSRTKSRPERKAKKASEAHPRYTIIISGCSPSVYKVIKEDEKFKYTGMLASRGIIYEHPYRQPASLRLLRNMKPFWSLGPE